MPRSRRPSRKDTYASMLGERQDILKRKAEQKLDIARRNFENAETRVRSYINSNPEKALMIAAGVGVAVGAIAASFFKGGRSRTMK